MRAAVLFLLSGCLAVPADPREVPADADAGVTAADAVTVGCVPGSTLDLAYVDTISYLTGGNQIMLAGGAVFINPGPNTILLPGFSAGTGTVDPSVLVDTSVGGAEGGLALMPGEAKGALSQGATAVVQTAFSEIWVDSAQPSLTETFTIGEPGPDVYEDTITVPLQVKAGDYNFDIVVTLTEDESKTTGTPLTAARATATCE